MNRIWYQRDMAVLGLLFLPFTAFYYLGWKIIDLLYSYMTKKEHFPCHVISVGNITVGGTGKTPFIMSLLEHFIGTGSGKILVLTRGYKGDLTGEVSDNAGFPDESRLIKSKYPHVTIWADKNRIKAYGDYVSRHGNPDVVILDDGFQHRKVYRDVDIVMIDGMRLFGNGMLFPSGPLREPVGSIYKRATIVVMKNAAHDIYEKYRACFPGLEVLNYVYSAVEFRGANGKLQPSSYFKDKNNIAFCGIANPESFRKTLDDNNIPVNRLLIFSDHERYNADRIAAILQNDADCFLTTAKDYVKIKDKCKCQKEIYVVEPVFAIKGQEKERYFSVPQRYVFLDRDGTICEDMDYLDDYRKMLIYPFSVEAVRIFKDKGYKVVVITNQSGVARGRFSYDEAVNQQSHVLNYFKQNGVELDGYYFCPHHKEGTVREYSVECDCRKPLPGLLLKATDGKNVDWKHSFVAGDKLIDIDLADSVNATGILVRTGYGYKELKKAKNRKLLAYDNIINFAQSL